MKTSFVLLLIAVIAVALFGNTQALFGRPSLKEECVQRCDEWSKSHPKYTAECKQECNKFFSVSDVKECRKPCGKYRYDEQEYQQCMYKCATKQPYSDSMAYVAGESCEPCFRRGCNCYKDRATGWASCRC